MGQLEPYNPSQVNSKLSLALSNARLEPEVSLAIINQCIFEAERAKDRHTKHNGYIARSKYYLQNKLFDEALLSANQAFMHAMEAGFVLEIHEALQILSQAHISRGLGDETLEYLYKGLDYAYQLNDSASIAWYLVNLPVIEFNLGNLGRAMEFSLKALTFFRQGNNPIGFAKTQYNLGIIHVKLGNYPLSLQYIVNGLETFRLHKDTLMIGRSLNALSNLYLIQNKIDSAFIYINQALNVFENFSNLEYLRTKAIYAEILINHKKMDEALVVLRQTIDEQKVESDVIGLSHSLLTLGNLYLTLDKTQLASECFRQCISITRNSNLNDLLRKAYKGLASAQGKVGNFHLAYRSLSEYIHITDSLFNLQKISEAVKLEEQADKDKYLSEIRLREQELERRKVLIAQQRKTQILLVIVILLSLGIAIFAYREYLIKMRANAKLSEQTKALEQQKRIADRRTLDFTDSLNYAKRIQQAILRASLQIKRHFPDSFLILIPRDIVSGDFYWVKEKNNLVLIALADCTGHGVPGALMSIIGTYGLNRLVNEMNLTNPSEILNSINTLFEESIEQQEGFEIFDGMDIGLCSYNPKSKELIYSGANIPLYIMRSVDSPPPTSAIAAKGQTHVLYQVKPNKQPIGSYFERTPFVSHSIKLMADDILYMFSDGFYDQFGGDDGKKFRSTQLLKLLCGIAEFPLVKQKEILEDTFTKWKGARNQVDDVSFVGVKI